LLRQSETSSFYALSLKLAREPYSARRDCEIPVPESTTSHIVSPIDSMVFGETFGKYGCS